MPNVVRCMKTNPFKIYNVSVESVDIVQPLPHHFKTADRLTSDLLKP